VRRTPSGEFELEVPAVEAIGLFTPEGERPWARGWDPVYREGEPSEAPGTVFTTAVGGSHTIWVIVEIDRPAGTAVYVRVTPGSHAGTVRVRCLGASSSRTVVSVSYDMSLLDGGDPADLDAFDETPFDATMNDWATAIATHLGSHPR